MRITVPTVIIAVALSCLTGYALSMYRFRWAVPLFFVFVAGNFVPFQILMVPVRQLSVAVGLYDTATGLILFHAAFQAGFCTLFMRNFIKALPFELIESARIEGVAEWRIFLHLVLPLVRPAVAALGVLIFTFIWNDFFWATVLIQGDHAMPITAGLKTLNGQFSSMATGFGRLDPGRTAAGRDVLYPAETFHCGPDARRDKRVTLLSRAASAHNFPRRRAVNSVALNDVKLPNGQI